MLRRMFLKGAAGMPFGTSRAQGFNNQAVSIFEAGNTIISKLGYFEYSGTPTAGNLIYSNAPSSGTDRFGNHYLGGGWAQYFAGQAIALQNPGAFQQYIGSLAGGWIPTASQIAFQASPRLIDLSGTIVATTGTAANPTIITTDNPVTVAPPANWTAIGAGIRYWMNIDNSVRFQISAQIAAGAVAGTINIVTLTGSYAPSKAFRGCAPGVFANGAPNNATFNSRFECTAAGDVHILGFPGGAAPGGVTEIDGQWDIPLN